MDLGLAGRSAVVTGGSKGIGLAIVRRLAAAGAQVIVGARKSSADLDELARTGQVRVVLADLADPAGPAALVEQAGERIDVLVNNVGGAPAGPGGSCRSPTPTGTPRRTRPNGSRPHHPRRAAGHARRGHRRDRHHLLSQRPAARSGRHRLQRRQSRPGELLQGPVQGSRAPRNSRQHRQPRPGRYRSVARRRTEWPKP